MPAALFLINLGLAIVFWNLLLREAELPLEGEAVKGYLVERKENQRKEEDSNNHNKI
jgi:hypothetical protein